PDSGTARPGLIAGFRWFASQVAYLLERLDSIPEGDGTMLDNTLIVWSSEFDMGARHRSRELPMLVLGGGGGHVGNQFFDFADTGRCPADVYTAVFNAFGYDDTSFGLPGSTTSPVSELFG